MAEDPEFERFMNNEPVKADKAPAWYGPVPPSQSKEVADQQSLTNYPVLRHAAIGASQIGVGLVQDLAAVPRWAYQGYNAFQGRDVNDIPNMLKPDVIGYNMTPNDLRPITPEERIGARFWRGVGEGAVFGPRGMVAGGVGSIIPGLLEEADASTPVTTVAGGISGASPAWAASKIAAKVGAVAAWTHQPAVANLAARVLRYTTPGILTGAGVGAFTGSTMGDLSPNYNPNPINPLTDYSGERLPLAASTTLSATQNVLDSQNALSGVALAPQR